ncbi:hypothetical protein [Halopiger djelfimassiliensis]|uniref:hypothetical protein n=1 Tax=Halopiger djelfimassiliensis TaxID=1293047 RepID=UPI0006780AC4|nr:hypothetical protein [Halopiger djelfimassiliensis]
MSERTSTSDTTGHVDRPFPGLAPPVRAIVSDALPPHDRSLPVALCTIAGEVGAETVPDRELESGSRAVDRRLEPVTNAVTSFEGYARIRHDLLVTDRYDRDDDRDAAVLASDYLHAAAYTMLDEAPVSDRRTLELYRIMIDGSTALSHRFLSWTDGDGPTGTADCPPEATLAETATALGAAAVGATSDVRSAMDAYGHALTTALSVTPSSDAPRETAVRVLTGRESLETSADGDTPSRGWASVQARRHDPSAVTSHLERAREALSRLTRRVDGTDATPVGSESVSETQPSGGPYGSPVARLRRATRIPFQDVPSTDE